MPRQTKAAKQAMAALQWVDAGEPDELPTELYNIEQEDLNKIIDSARSCPPGLRGQLLGRTS